MALCRDCKHYDLEAFRLSNGKLRVLTNKAARCTFDMDRLNRKMPASLLERQHTTTRSLMWMRPDDGNGCPQWAKRDEVKA